MRLSKRNLTHGKQKGQVLLVTLLVLTIATTVALSLISRTTTDTTITTQIEQSSRAFSAAEAGVEEALKSGTGTAVPQVLTGSDASYSVTVSSIQDAAGIYMFPQKTSQGQTETLWLVSHNAAGGLVETPTYRSGSIGICWSAESVTPAMVATLLYRESSDNSYRIYKAAFDPNSSRSSSNRFTSTYTAGGCGAGTGTAYRVNLTYPSINPNSDTLLALRVRPVYSDAVIGIDSGAVSLPVQAKRIESTGSTDTGTNRKIVVYQQYRSPSTVFDSALYSQSSIAK